MSVSQAEPPVAVPNRTQRTLLRVVWRIARVCLVAYLSVLVLACVAQRRLLYFPQSRPVALPTGTRYSALREVDLTASDGAALKAWYWPHRIPLTLVVFHGNAGDRSHRLSWLETLRETGAGIFILDYRGYGGSAGSPSEEGLYRDGEAAVAWLEARGVGPLVYVGESLGSAVAVETALRRRPEALVLQSPFSSAVEVGRRAYPFLPVSLLLRDRYPLIDRIQEVACPVMVIHGEADTIVPASMGHAVFERARGKKEWLGVPGADHNDPLWVMAPGYSERLATFLGISR